jgi:hypothetical protein
MLQREVYYMLGRMGLSEMLIVPLLFSIPVIILYFVIKSAIKNAIKELKKDGTL